MEHRSTQQLLSEGLTHRDLRRAVTVGELVRLRRGSYLPTAPESPEELHRHLVEATMPGLDGVVLSHGSAAVLHGLWLPDGPPGLVQVVRPRTSRGGGQRNGVVHTHTGQLAGSDLMLVDGLAVTTPARTLLDCARGLGFDEAVMLLDAALHDPADPGQERAGLRASLDEASSRLGRVAGVRNARAALAFADGRAESPLESRSRIVLWRQGLPTPELQYAVRDQWGHLIARLDFAWPEERVYGECDGQVKYGQLLAPGETASHVVMREKHRDNQLADRGWRQVRWMEADLARPRLLDARIRRALAGAAA